MENCPYCSSKIEINHDDGYGYAEDVTHQQECGHCGKTFVYTTTINYYYELNKAECLNGGVHKWEPTTTIPRQFTRMYCTMCGKERKPTDDEMAYILTIQAETNA